MVEVNASPQASRLKHSASAFRLKHPAPVSQALIKNFLPQKV